MLMCGILYYWAVRCCCSASRPPGIYTLSLHDALPISDGPGAAARGARSENVLLHRSRHGARSRWRRSEEHTSELQSRRDLVCRLLLEKKKGKKRKTATGPYASTGGYSRSSVSAFTK